MNRTQKNRLISILLVVPLISIAIGLILFALRQNINLFYTPSQLIALPNQPKQSIRLGGYVKTHSVHYDNSGEQVSFLLTDKTNHLLVLFKGVLPNLFKEGQTVVVTGKLNDQHQLIASQILAKHDERYMPKMLKE